MAAIERALAAITRVCEQDPEAGQAGLQDIGRRFGWLTAPRSTVVQPGPVHTGLTSDPAAEASGCCAALVRRAARWQSAGAGFRGARPGWLSLVTRNALAVSEVSAPLTAFPRRGR